MLQINQNELQMYKWEKRQETVTITEGESMDNNSKFPKHIKNGLSEKKWPIKKKKYSVTPTSLLISELGLSNETPLLSNIRIALNPRIHWLPNFQSQPKHYIQ